MTTYGNPTPPPSCPFCGTIIGDNYEEYTDGSRYECGTRDCHWVGTFKYVSQALIERWERIEA